LQPSFQSRINFREDSTLTNQQQLRMSKKISYTLIKNKHVKLV
jgi:hypothetical protein